jgi:hypothetical protein
MTLIKNKVTFRFREIVILLLITLLPFKLFSLKLGLIFSFSRILTLVALSFAAIILVQNLRNRFTFKSESRTVFILFLSFSIYIFVCYLSSLWLYIDHQNFTRVHIMSMRVVEHIFIIPLCFMTLTSNRCSRERLLLVASKLWKWAIFLGFLQSIISLVGIFISYESIGEPSLENKATAFGLTFMRASSVFGEPRDLAGLVIPIFFFYHLIRGTTMSAKDWILLFSIGVLTFSSTFLLALIGLLIGFVFSRLSLKGLPFVCALCGCFFVIFITGIWSPFIEWLLSPIPRFSLILDLVSNPSILATGEKIDGDIAEQISDLMLVHYILSGEVFSWSGLFGNGLGSSQIFLQEYANFVYGYHVTEKLLGSRFLVFIFLIDFGVIGCFILFSFVSILIRRVAVSCYNQRQFYFYCFGILFSSLFYDGYFFVLLCLALIVLDEKRRADQGQQPI